MDPVKKYMSSPAKVIDGESPVCDAAAHMANEKIGALLVQISGEYAGIVTETDITRKVVGGKMTPESTKVSDIMSESIISIDQTEPMPKANELMHKHKIRHLAVTKDDKIIGVLSVKNLVHYFEDWFQLTL